MRKEIFCLLLALVISACGGGAEAPAPSATPPPSPEPAPPPFDPATAAAITGKAVLEGKAPVQDRIQMGADPVCMKLHPTAVTTEFVVTNPDGTLQNVFVYVKEGLGNRKFPVSTEPLVLDQKGCTYHPHVFGIMAGQPLQILNSDPTLHNIHAMPKVNAQFNIGQPVQGLKTTKSFSAPEVMVPFKCDVHKWMNAYAGVLDHPYYSVTRESGSFEIKNLPPGDYVIEAWHEKYGAQTQNVTVGPKESKAIQFTFKAS